MSNEKKNYWMSIEDSTGQKKPLSGEFVSPPHTLTNSLPSNGNWARREFLQLMGAGLALGASGCFRRPAEKIVPYVNRPPDVIPGEANFYASSYFDGMEGFAILVRSREGRPVKVEGNREAGILNSQGLSPMAHGHLLSLYDPERLKNPKKNLFNDKKTNKETINTTYSSLDESLVQEFKKGSLALLTPRIPSPSTSQLIKDFQKSFPLQHYIWDPISLENFEETQKESYGERLVPSFNLENVRFLFSLSCDPLGVFLSPTEFQRQFAKTRKPSKEMSRLVVLESLMSLTGSNADERLRIRPSENVTAIMALAFHVHQKINLPVSSETLSLIKSYRKAWEKLPVPIKKWEEWSNELIKHQGRGLILYGGNDSSEKTVHIMVNLLNSLLGNDGKTVNYRQPYTGPFGRYQNMKNLIEDINSGQVKRLLIHKVNPLYSYPEKEELLEAIKKVELVVYTGDRIDETGSHAHYVVPDSHDLEKWGDWEFKKGVFSVGQPTIRPLYNTRSFEDSLIKWIKRSGKNTLSVSNAENFYQYVKAGWEKKYPASWNQFLKKGVSGAKKTLTGPSRKLLPEVFQKLKPYKDISTDSYELVLYETSGLKQGNLANVSWLQEFPDPVTKICWDNYICVSPATALKENLKEGEILNLSVKGQNLKAPLHIQPGQSEGTLALALGYGRSLCGKVGKNVGVNAWPLISITKKTPVLSGLIASFEKTKEFIPLANVQGHHSMEGRDIILETTLPEFLNNPSSGIPKGHKVVSLWAEHKYKGHKWGMTIDLNACSGCGACMVACQSENNIPVVGKKYVLEGREMHWIRVDRYYKGETKNPKALHQPVVCMHCDNAPCETVCPVLATVHSSEGTNDMIYNRCVGTRYCSNNCPYKVRRFNWFNYTKNIEKPQDMALNPDVTIRSRGVMEKCTFCIQRVQSGKGKAKKEGRLLKDGDIQTACQQSCPSEAIVFGDLNDKTAKVSENFSAPNSYALLHEMLNTKPSVKYQTKVRNSNQGTPKKSGGH